ncbi:hypothetical protein BGZ83_004408 [Gryganskiella cystojenkinii]|nr:hypothetical protein BGZ83_004408 [Gryganskiella cystojenkinii]
MSVTMASSNLRSPQHIKPHITNSNSNGGGNAYSSDELPTITPNAPQRPPRQRHGSVSTSPSMSGSQYYQHYHQQHLQHQQHQQQQYQYEQYMSSSPPSSRPSPRSSQPSSPMTFQLPPSALSTTREESLRSGSISYHPSTNGGYNTQPIQVPQLSSSSSSAASSYRTPQMTPGMNGGGGSGGLAMAMMPPLSLPDSFLDDQEDYAEYYSDVGFSGTATRQQHQLTNIQTMPILLQHQQLHQSMDYPLSPASNRNGQQGGFLPSPHMTPAVSPLSDDFPSLSLDDSVPARTSMAPRFNTESIAMRPEGYYQGHPHVPIDSFFMPKQEQYPPDTLLLFGGTATHSEGGMFRKEAKEYLMLTNTSLLKYKTMEKASKVFGNQSVWSSTTGHQILTPQQTAQISKDNRILSLNSVVGVHTHQPAGSELQIVIEYLVSISSQPATMHFTPAPEHIVTWLKELRQGCNYHAPQAGLVAKGTRQRQWVVEKLRDDHIALPQSVAENDITALTAGGMWRAYFKVQKIKGVPVQENTSTNDSKVPLEGKVVVIAVGKSFIHVLPHNLGNGSTKDDLKDERAILQYPILSVKAIQYLERDDSFSVSFGTALRQRKVVMTFSSARAREIIIAIRARVESLRWLYPLGRKGIDLAMSETLAKPIPVPSKDYLSDLGFEDLLRAECHAMNVDRKTYNNVRVDGFTIKVGKTGETPEARRDYSVDEMKCLLRALRFNTTFKEISFNNISFAALQKPRTLKDGTIRYGLRLDKEFYELVMGNPQIRHLDLHNCSLDTSTVGSIGRAIRDGFTAGLRLEYLDLSGNNASDGADVMTLAKGIVKHAGTLHGFSVGYCQITGDGINQLMHAFVANPDVASHALETFGIQGNVDSKVNTYILDMFLKHSMRLQQLNLSETSWSKAPILMAEALTNCGGFLTSLDLSGMALHPLTLDQLLSWVSSPGFQSMDQLKVEGCGLDGVQFGSLLDAIGQSRNLKVEVLAGRNLLSDGNDLPESLVAVLTSGDTATSLGLRQTCWSEQSLRQLFVALSQNWTLKKLDLSSVSLASNRDPDVETCQLLGQMMSSNSSRLEELSIRGEETADLTSRMGRNLWKSFQGIGQSRYLTRLDVRQNRFKDQGAHALAEALCVNQSLTWLDMDENDVTIEGFNAILSSFHPGGTEHVPTGSRFYNSTLCHFEVPVKDVEKQTMMLKDSMLENYKSEQEIRFMLANATGKDAREWKERLAQCIRQRNVTSEVIAQIDRAIKGIVAATERNKAAMDAVIRDRERRRDREIDRERERERDQSRLRDSQYQI